MNTAEAVGHPPAIDTSEEAMTIMPATSAQVPTIDGDQLYVDLYRVTEPGETDLFETVIGFGDAMAVLSPDHTRALMAALAASLKQTNPKPSRTCTSRFPHRARKAR